MASNRIDRLLAPDYLEGLATMPMAEVRARRTECQEVEVALSYLRRLVQGRLDIIHADLQRRAGGVAPDLAGLVDDLKNILADRVRGPGQSRLPTLLAPAALDTEITAELDAVVDDIGLGSVSDSTEAEVTAMADRLGELERQVSDQRRQLHERIDAIQEEIVRRYKTGEATVDTLLQ